MKRDRTIFVRASVCEGADQPGFEHFEQDHGPLRVVEHFLDVILMHLAMKQALMFEKCFLYFLIARQRAFSAYAEPCRSLVLCRVEITPATLRHEPSCFSCHL